MTGLCRLCGQLVSGALAGQLAERSELEMVNLAESAVQHLRAWHPEVLPRISGVLRMCGAYMAALTLSLQPEAEAVLKQFSEALILAVNGLGPVLDFHEIPWQVPRRAPVAAE